VAAIDGGPVALLFGREDRGLSNDALDRCHRVVTIPSDPSYASLNLAHAVIIMLYELALARGVEQQPSKAPRRPSEPAPADELGSVRRRGAGAQAIDFFKTRNADGVMRTMREIAHRTPLDLREVKLLRAIAIEVTKYGERLARSRLHVDR
jgi:TrmH family RNA methyltransferase